MSLENKMLYMQQRIYWVSVLRRSDKMWRLNLTENGKCIKTEIMTFANMNFTNSIKNL